MTQSNSGNSNKDNSKRPAFSHGFGLKSHLLNIYDTFWDIRLGVNTFGYKPSLDNLDAPDFRVHYTPTPYRKLFRILTHLKINSSDKFLDLGCGLGRAVFVASWLGAQQSIGVDADLELITTARENIKKSKLRTLNINFICSPVETYKFPEVTVIYMFHPFGPGTLQQVINSLEQDLKTNPRRICVAYENPVHANILDKSLIFQKFDELPAVLSQGSPYSVTFWENEPK